jgi:hypothetical protein
MNCVWMAKNRGEQLHIRIDDAVKTDLKMIADYNGQTMSGMVYQLILQAIRRAKADEPQVFAITPEPKIALRKLPDLGEVGKPIEKAARKKKAG